LKEAKTNMKSLGGDDKAFFQPPVVIVGST